LAQGVRVVLADDTPDIRALLRLLLVRAGYDVVGEAGTGAEAVALAQEHQPDVVIVDLAMPVMDGLEAIALIRVEAPDAKIVAFSGFKSERVEAEAMAAGAHAFVEKGAPPPEMVATIASVVSGHAVDAASLAVAAAKTSDEDLKTMIHALMGPLTVIEGFAGMIEAGGELLSAEELRDYGGRIVRSASHLRSLVQAMADARRIEGGSLTVSPELFDMGPLVAEVVADLDAVTSPHPVTIDAEPGFVVNADPVRIRQVLTNLLSNAAKFSGDHSPIDVSVGGGDGVVEVSVKDHGPGIPDDRRGLLFGRYSRLANAAPGLGIGLYISRGIARAHGGDVTLAPFAEGEGARFVLRLPAADAAVGSGEA
jgi:signal transduction histidine kinase